MATPPAKRCKSPPAVAAKRHAPRRLIPSPCPLLDSPVPAPPLPLGAPVAAETHDRIVTKLTSDVFQLRGQLRLCHATAGERERLLTATKADLTRANAELHAAATRTTELTKETEALRAGQDHLDALVSSLAMARSDAQVLLNQRMADVRQRLGIACAIDGCPSLDEPQMPLQLPAAGCVCTVQRRFCTHCIGRATRIHGDRVGVCCPLCRGIITAWTTDTDQLTLPARWTLEPIGDLPVH